MYLIEIHNEIRLKWSNNEIQGNNILSISITVAKTYSKYLELLFR